MFSSFNVCQRLGFIALLSAISRFLGGWQLIDGIASLKTGDKTLLDQYKYYQETPEHHFQTLLAAIAKQQNNLRSDIDH